MTTNIKDVMARISYDRPGYKLINEGNVINIIGPAELNRDTGKEAHRSNKVGVDLTEALESGESIEQIINERVRPFLIGFEAHEIDEWLEIDGKVVNDPHATEEASAPTGGAFKLGYSEAFMLVFEDAYKKGYSETFMLVFEDAYKKGYKESFML